MFGIGFVCYFWELCLALGLSVSWVTYVWYWVCLFVCFCGNYVEQWVCLFVCLFVGWVTYVRHCLCLLFVGIMLGIGFVCLLVG